MAAHTCGLLLMIGTDFGGTPLLLDDNDAGIVMMMMMKYYF